MELHTIGIDLGKTVFHLVGLNRSGEVVVRKRFSRRQLRSSLQTCTSIRLVWKLAAEHISSEGHCAAKATMCG